ncbi:hypothetical protein D6201_06890 [Aurantiacibacter aquimixticola]|uniref:Uncharacterized protein n=2 Tax=Aurantiacibacter aquimixticola TaxID=1958945 RepID=A0A419RTK4_9SPHN|nr:hypothetical protein D6201_06890 [Aurantiacibacter aquimixticola]
MLEDDPHCAYRELLNRTALAIVPDATAEDVEISKRLRRIRTHLKGGASYDKLSQDLQFARNPALVSTHKNKTRKRLSRTVERTTKAAAEATADALAKNLVADQARLELELFDSAEPLAEDVPQSRENPSEDGYNLRYLKRLIGKFSAHDVSRSAVQSAPSYALSIAAELIGWATRDREFEDPQNPIPHLHQVGVFECWRDELSDEEAVWIDRAAALDRTCVMDEVRRVFGIDLPIDYPMSSAALMGMARLADADNPMAKIDWDLHRTAGEKLESNEVAFVQSSLGLDESRRAVAEATVSFLKRRIEDETIRNFELSVPFGHIRLMIDALDPASNETDDWVPRFCEKIQTLAEQLAPVVRSEEVFFALMHAAHEHSFAKVKFNEMDAVKRAGDRHRRNMEALDEALASGLQFKFRSDGMVILEDHPDFHLIAQQPMTRETYMSPASTPCEDEAGVACGSVEETQTELPPEDDKNIQGAGIPFTRTAEREASHDEGSTDRSPPIAREEGAGPRVQTELRDSPRDEVSEAGESASEGNEATSREVDAAFLSDARAVSTEVTILPPIRTHERRQRRQASLFDVNDKDVI